ncbi:NUDIX hydrolase [Frankia sp. AgB32]|uniref:NUDIX domain-containing protein n=1 Tax=Frankia sp. AgB32 TaxID=631119 RepID=UPI00200F7604|nr:NUDIX hydrolase [Frankia sp. AgB32]MCK9895241.1 NUDIX hydrolase [Frankia sp. AgB32]
MTDTHETARLTADVVALSERDGVPHVLLIRRGWPPYAGMWALPGGHLDAGERPETAAVRELAEETGMRAPELRLLGVYAEPGRDPRGRYITWAYTTTLADTPAPTAGTDAAAARWVPAHEALHEGLAFDHGDILRGALVPAGAVEAIHDALDGAGDAQHHIEVCAGQILGRTQPTHGPAVRWTATLTITAT